MKKSNIISREIQSVRFESILKMLRYRQGINQQEASDIVGMDITRYQKYEQGRIYPNSYSLASGMLIDLGLDKDIVDRLLDRSHAKPLEKSGFDITDRESALIQWFDQQLEACMLSFKPLGRFGALSLFLANHVSFSHWLPFKHTGDLVKWLDKKGVSYTKQSAHQQYEKIRDSFVAVSKDLEKVESDSTEIVMDENNDHSVSHIMNNRYY